MNHMKRAKEEYISAVNGLEALHKYQSEHQNIKVIFMGMNSISSEILQCSNHVCNIEHFLNVQPNLEH